MRQETVQVGHDQLRALHRALEALARAEHGEVRAHLWWQRRDPGGGAPRGVASQLWVCRLPTGHAFALVHLYRDARGEVVEAPQPRYLRTAHLTWYPAPPEAAA